MSSTSKKIFLIASVIVPFVIYSVVYYVHVFRNAPYKFAEFKYVTFSYGPGDSLINKYDSRTGDYQFVNSNDSLMKMNIHLSKKDLKKLHDKASLLGFWDWPSNETGDSTLVHNGTHAPHYVMELAYKRKSKKVDFEESFSGDPKLKAANEQMYKETRDILDSVARSQNKH